MIEKYEELIKRSRNFYDKWVGKVCEDNLGDFIGELVKLDSFRFGTSYEWYEPCTSKDAHEFIFENPNPDKGLLLFFICCWLDMQSRYKIVWSNYLRKAVDWIEDPERFERPRGEFRHTATNIDKTLSVAKKNNYISKWFINTILKIVKENGNEKGNLYRFIGHVMIDLLEPSKSLDNKIYWLTKGYSELIGEWKRVWMFLMFLRRDKTIIKNLLTKAVSNKKDGTTALEYWYDSEYFSENESEIPVDVRVKEAWPRLWGFREQNEKTVGNSIHKIANDYKIPPSTFDIIFFGIESNT